MYKDKSIFIKILLVIWQLPQIITGLLVFLLFRKYEVYTNPYNHISVWKVNHKGLFGTACFSSGPIIFVTPKAPELILLHETGHSKQSLIQGPFFHLFVSIPSICLFWYRRIKKKSDYWYHSKWPESQANKFSNIDLSVYK